MAGKAGVPVEYLATTRIGQKGQFTVPKEYLADLGLDAGAIVAVLRIGNGLILVPEQPDFRRLCDSIASALQAHQITPEDLESALPETRRRVFARRYPRLARKTSANKVKRQDKVR